MQETIKKLLTLLRAGAILEAFAKERILLPMILIAMSTCDTPYCLKQIVIRLSSHTGLSIGSIPPGIMYQRVFSWKQSKGTESMKGVHLGQSAWFSFSLSNQYSSFRRLLWQ
jgi:hypothetical protein